MTESLGWIENGAHVVALRIHWEDTDAAGLVYYANYLRFTERARSNMLRWAGIGQTALLERDGIFFAVRNCELEYLRAARHDDEIEVHTTVTGMAGATVSASQIIKRGGTDLVRSRVRLACISRDGRPRRLPPDVRRVLATLPNSMKG